MPLKPRYCAQCGAAVETRTVDGRAREVCPACGTVFYLNPLPVASALVLNEKREVLLVKRRNEPCRGKWCLPIGFAEMNETIDEAALRELQEEAGITGRILHHLDVDSYQSDFYGDLLIVTFEAVKTGGREQAGDDAEDVGYFALDQLPPLAFAANEKAVRACLEVHHEEWAIQDSFARLQRERSAEMLSDALVTMIRDRAEQIARAWLEEVRSNPTTPSYATARPEPFLERATLALRQLGRWLRGAEANQEVRAFYRDLGAERQAAGFVLPEVLSSLTLLRKHIYAVARSEGVWARPIDAYRVLELDRRLVLFFDKAMYHVAKGFTKATPSGSDPAVS